MDHKQTLTLKTNERLAPTRAPSHAPAPLPRVPAPRTSSKRRLARKLIDRAERARSRTLAVVACALALATVALTFPVIE